MAGIETKFGGVPDHKGPFARKSYEIERLSPKKSKTKRREVIIIDVNTPLSRLEGRKKR